MVVVLVVGSGAAWESDALARIDAAPGLVVLKRCVDVDDLLATASSGQADAAVLGLDSPGLDLAAVDHLRRHGVRPVAVAPGDGSIEAARVRAARVGIHTLLGAGDLAALPDLLGTAELPPPRVPPPGAGPVPAPPGHPPAPDGLGRPSRGRVVAVWGPAGAPGRTTLAIGLAAELARRTPRVVLVDADPCGGTVAQALGILDEVSGLLSATRLAASGALEERFASVQRALDPRLSVVTGLPRADRWAEVRAGTVEAVLEVAREEAYVVVDTGASLEEDPSTDYGSRPGRHQMTLAALASADEVVVVGTPDPVGLARLTRGLVELREVLGPRPVRVVVNRMRASLGWSERDVTELLSGAVGALSGPGAPLFLPEDRAALDRALVTGRTPQEAAADSPFVRGLGRLADDLVPGSLPGRAPLLRRRRAGRALRR